MTTTSAPLRFGILGAARIAPAALINPARTSPASSGRGRRARRSQGAGVRRQARHRARARTYDALLADPEIDAIYNPLPNGLHGEWTIAALDAGKHVLCEKPFTANAEEAEEVAAVAGASGRVVMEAFH